MPNRPISKLNLPSAGLFNTGPASAEIASVTPTPIPTITAPTGLALTTANEQSAVTPASLIQATWVAPAGVAPTGYTSQVATDSGFTNIVDGMNVPTELAVFHGLNVNTLYYVRVAAIAGGVVGAWSAAVSITTALDVTAPSVPTGTGAAFAGVGDLVVIWTNSVSGNLRDTEVKIWSDSGKTTLYATLFDATGRVVWPASQNLVATSNVGDPTLYVELRSHGWNGLFSSAVVLGTFTKSAPSAPTVTLVRGATQVLAASISSARAIDAAKYEFAFKRDGGTVQTTLTTDTIAMYELSDAADAGSHSWTVVARAQDGLLQFSSASAASSAVVMDVMTIEYLRAGAIYSDSDSNTFTPPASGTLAALKDDNRVSGGVSYAA